MSSLKMERNRLFRTFILVFLLVAVALAAGPVDIQTKNGNLREVQAREELKDILGKYDLSKYTFTRQVVFEQGAMNHAFPVLTMNVRFVRSDVEMLSSFLHEQLHWWLRDHPNEMQRAVPQLRALQYALLTKVIFLRITLDIVLSDLVHHPVMPFSNFDLRQISLH